MSDYTLEGPKWAGSTITWSFTSGGGDFTNPIGAAYQGTIEAAVAEWAQATGLHIQEVSDTIPGVDIRIGWGSFSGSQIGQTDYSYQPGAAETFTPGMTIRIEDPSLKSLSPVAGSYYQGTTTELYQVALHEFGHALGLGLSSDPSAVMFLSLGPSNTDISAADLAGTTALYGAPSAPPVTASAATVNPAPALPPLIAPTGNDVAVYRFFDSSTGTQFLTADAGERNTLIENRSDLTYEGFGMNALSSPANDPNAVAVYRFFDTRNGSHFFTASAAEESQIASTRSDLVLEQTTFYEHDAQQAGDVPVYRFFDSNNGTHFFTESASERASLVATRPDMVAEGVAFYAPAA